jgi:hypothetical protein
MSRTLQSLIEEKIPFRHLGTGWFSGRGACCGDYKERAGFLFEDGKVIYNCWNCGQKHFYEEDSRKLNHRFKKLLVDGYGIPIEELREVISSSFFNKEATEPKVITKTDLAKIPAPIEIAIPDWFIPLGSEQMESDQLKAIAYLEKRHVDPLGGEYGVSLLPKLKDHVVILFRSNGKLVYWQARYFGSDPKIARYSNCTVTRTSIMYNVDELFRYSSEPIFITEGIFDSIPLNGVALMGSSLNEAKLAILKKSRRRLIFVIDKNANGQHVATAAMAAGFEITFSPGDDVNSSIGDYGLLWTIRTLLQRTRTPGIRAELDVKTNCR